MKNHQEGGERVLGSCDCSIVVLRLVELQWTVVEQVLSRSNKERGTDASAITPGTYVFCVQWENCVN